MLAAVLSTAALAYWDEKREAGAALEGFAEEQVTLARSVALQLHARFAQLRGAGLNGTEAAHARQDVAAELQALARAIDRQNELALLLLPASGTVFEAASGARIEVTSLARALHAGQSSLRLLPSEAERLGLPRRTALAGLARVDAGEQGTWGIAAVASARRERDREQRAEWRLLLAVLVAGGLVLAFGGAALRIQRKELALEHDLALANLQRHADERLERASKIATMGTLAMGIAHEVSTPLGVITGRAEQLFAKLEGDERAARGLRAILEQADRINQIVRAFLGLARGESPPARRIAPAAIVDGATALVAHRLAEAGVRLSADVPVGLPEVHGDLHLLQHALVNLLLNARDACAGSGEVEIRVRLVGGVVCLQVSDDGEGISAATAAHAKEAFFTTKGHGSGLGLAIANEIAKTHGGTLSVLPRTPRGTLAAIELPVAARESHAA